MYLALISTGTIWFMLDCALCVCLLGCYQHSLACSLCWPNFAGVTPGKDYASCGWVGGWERESALYSRKEQHLFFSLRQRTEEGETSVSKHAKIEERSRTQPISSSLWEDDIEESQSCQSSLAQKMSQSCRAPSKKSVPETSKPETSAAKNIPAGPSASKKRKELDDLTEDSSSLELVFASKELDWEEDVKDSCEESVFGIKKKRKLDMEGVQEPPVLQEGSAGDMEAKRLSVRAFLIIKFLRWQNSTLYVASPIRRMEHTKLK